MLRRSNLCLCGRGRNGVMSFVQPYSYGGERAAYVEILIDLGESTLRTVTRMRTAACTEPRAPSSLITPNFSLVIPRGHFFLFFIFYFLYY